mgnify:CR=1 FL=1
MEFESFQKIPRLKRQCVITEKIDGTNAQIAITEDGKMFVGSRNKWITPEDDNYGFARWAREHEEELLTLGVGRHYGEWWGKGIQRRYKLKEKRFSLFNVHRWTEGLPSCCSLVPVLYQGDYDTSIIDNVMESLASSGSLASPGFMNPEGIVVYHSASRDLYKMTFEHDKTGKPE